MLDQKEIESLLIKLCIDLGFCLSPQDSAHIQSSPPEDVDSFSSAVIIAEGFDPQTIDRNLYRQVRSLVEKAFKQHHEV